MLSFGAKQSFFYLLAVVLLAAALVLFVCVSDAGPTLTLCRCDSSNSPFLRDILSKRRLQPSNPPACAPA